MSVRLKNGRITRRSISRSTRSMSCGDTASSLPAAICTASDRSAAVSAAATSTRWFTTSGRGMLLRPSASGLLPGSTQLDSSQMAHTMSASFMS